MKQCANEVGITDCYCYCEDCEDYLECDNYSKHRIIVEKRTEQSADPWDRETNMSLDGKLPYRESNVQVYSPVELKVKLDELEKRADKLERTRWVSNAKMAVLVFALLALAAVIGVSMGSFVGYMGSIPWM